MKKNEMIWTAYIPDVSTLKKWNSYLFNLSSWGISVIIVGGKNRPCSHSSGMSVRPYPKIILPRDFAYSK